MEEALTVVIDGTRPPSAETVQAVHAVCDAAEDRAGSGTLAVHVTGVPAEGWTTGLDVTKVSKWERALRRLERVPRATVAVASGDCGGAALDAFLACDIRVLTPGTRLLVPKDTTATWPGMAGYRLVQLAGPAPVRRALLFGQPIEAADALRTGLADELTDDPAGALAAAARLAGTLAGEEIAIRRQLHFDAATTSFEEALGAHLAACDRMLRTPAKAAS
ncbi:enoyl-CoA hydratase/isomerase family protein [Streptomyces sp. TRM S81-3]|uniref:Enoyl-CoA hydratase/isomerase family protein n=1 Tax=Streptomyces griseicoloratus TaxID=2752516 RepID=A0A926L6R7_9ACTN|nr:enoyl-CoA-hydratase DpgB [Streptomyces griseicoloratus]MBD0422089.1 enoyl-CoA hydratase/isomerase family protein [Streptomyces griseicoloratus]